MSQSKINKSFDEIERECARFLYKEAELLDAGLFERWFELLAPDIDYRVPVRTTMQKKDGEGFSDSAFFFEEDYGSIKLRVTRLATDYAWSESPPARTRRSITNVRLSESDSSQAGLKDNERAVKSNLAMFTFRGEGSAPVILTAERHDVVTWTGGDWKLKQRVVLLDTTILGMDSLAVFI
jgi:3-phenylpropionate/cinnamic acid dioxygenase small subunit